MAEPVTPVPAPTDPPRTPWNLGRMELAHPRMTQERGEGQPVERVEVIGPIEVSTGCGVRQPGSTKWCERTDEHTEHRATLTPGRTHCYWTDGGVVSYRVGEVHPDPNRELREDTIRQWLDGLR